MKILIDRTVTFDFPAGYVFVEYDKTSYYIRNFQGVCASKAVDLVAIDDTHNTGWLIEVKDYTRPMTKHPNITCLADDLVKKIRDSLAGVLSAKFGASSFEYEFAKLFVQCKEIEVVFHVKFPVSGIHSTPLANLANKLKQAGITRTKLRWHIVDKNNPALPWSIS